MNERIFFPAGAFRYLLGVHILVLVMIAPRARAFEEDQRINGLTMQFGTDAFAAANAFGGAFGSLSQAPLQTAISAGISSGSTSLVFEMPGLTDLTGTNQPSLPIGVVNAVPFTPFPALYHGASDLDWWYTPNASELDVNGVPTNQVLGTITASKLTAGPGRITFAPDPLNPLVQTGGRLDVSSAVIKATVGSSSAPLESTNTYPPGHLPSENLNPLLLSFASMSAGQLKGNITAASLASTAIPASFVGTATTEGFTVANTMLDLVLSGAHKFGMTLVTPTQPDQADADAPVTGAGQPYKFTLNAAKVVTGCRDKNNAAVDLTAGLNAAAYSAYFAFTTDRVIINVPEPSTPGDYNRNGVVDASDYVVWRANQGTNNVLANDPIGGTIGAAQYNVWRVHFGQPPGSGAALPSAESLSVAVPEPATMTLTLMMFVVSAGFRCRGRLLPSRWQGPSRALAWAAWMATFIGGADVALAFTTIYPGPPIVPSAGGFNSPSISGVNDSGTVIGVERKANDDHPYRWDGSGAAPVALGQTSATNVVGIDNSGTAVGQTGDGSPPVYWPSSGTAPANLAIPAGWSGAAPIAINGTGTIVGFGGGASGLSAVRWANSGATATELGTVPAFGADASYYAYAVNAGGIAVGEVGYNPMLGGFGARPIRWDAAGSATQLGDLGTYPTSDVFDNASTAFSINAAGTAVGQLLKNGGSALGYRAVRWDASGTAATELGNLGTTASGATTDSAQAINDAGTIAGRAEKYNLAGTLLGSRAVRWNSGQTVAIELGNLGTNLSGVTGTDIGSARPMNAAGTIVGVAQKYDLAGNLLGNRAVYWGANATAVDLNSLVDPASGWVLTSASAISDTDWIAGNGLFDPDGAGGQAAYDRMFLLQLPPLAGDYNNNGIVDAADYIIWRKGLGTTYTQADYNTWRSHFGQTAGSGAGAAANAAVPEPATVLLLMFAADGWCLRRRRAV